MNVSVWLKDILERDLYSIFYEIQENGKTQLVLKMKANSVKLLTTD